MRIAVLASGSSGNSLVVSSGGTSVLVDAGISYKRTAEAMEGSGIDAETLRGVLVTHEHSDHVQGLGPVSRRLGLTVYASAGTHDRCAGRVGRCPERVVVEAGEEFEIGELAVFPFALSHDCAEPIGYSLSDGRHRVAIATDLGVVGGSVRHHLAIADCVVLEFNHDERMLIDGTYPWHLKRRIMSNVGHLSNGFAARELERLADGPMSTLILAHISRENNTPDLALATARAVLEQSGRPDVNVVPALQNEWLAPLEVGWRAGGSEAYEREPGTQCTR